MSEIHTFMAPEDKFKELWNDPGRIRLAIEMEDLSVVQLAEYFFIKGFKFAQRGSVEFCRIIQGQAIRKALHIMMMVDRVEKENTVIAVAGAIEKLIDGMGTPPEEPKTRH